MKAMQLKDVKKATFGWLFLWLKVHTEI